MLPPNQLSPGYSVPPAPRFSGVYFVIDHGSNNIKARAIPFDDDTFELRPGKDGKDYAYQGSKHSKTVPVNVPALLNGDSVLLGQGERIYEASLTELRAWMDERLANDARKAGKSVLDSQTEQQVFVRAVGTAMFRKDKLLVDQLQAKNRAIAGIDVTPIPVEEEGRLALQGFLFHYPEMAKQSFTLIDVGGGSTELTFHPANANPEDVKVVSLTLGNNDPPAGVARPTDSYNAEQLNAYRAGVKAAMDEKGIQPTKDWPLIMPKPRWHKMFSALRQHLGEPREPVSPVAEVPFYRRELEQLLLPLTLPVVKQKAEATGEKESRVFKFPISIAIVTEVARYLDASRIWLNRKGEVLDGLTKEALDDLERRKAQKMQEQPV